MASHNRTTASEINLKVDDIPTVPTIGTATAGAESASITFTASTKGGTASTYTALSNPGSVTGSAASSPVTVTGLTAGTAYTFTVRGNNSTGSSEYSSASNSITPTVATSYESIATVTVSTATPTISFTSIPATYTHLQLRGITRDARSVNVNNINMRLGNGSIDSGGNYAMHTLDGDGSAVSAAGAANQTALGFWIEAGASSTANAFSSFVVDILDYKNTNKYKTIKVLGGADLNGSGNVHLISGLWQSTSAVTNIEFFNNGNFNFVQYSTFALYGIKGA